MTDSTSLQNLHPIVLPPEVGVWPPAPGWYVVLAVLLLLSGRFLHLYYKKLQANRYRYEARAELLRILSHVHKKNLTGFRKLPLLVKSTALHVYPRKRVARLHGDEWLRFLDSTIDSDQFSQGVGHLLPKLSYSSPENLAAITNQELKDLFKLLEYWLLNHRVPAEKVGGHDV